MFSSACTRGTLAHANGGQFSPALIPFTTGLWLDMADGSTGFQDSAGTTPNVQNSPIGKRLDKSGNGNHMTQATAGLLPLWKLNGAIYSDLFDGVNDGYSAAAITLGTDMDCFIGIRRSSAAAGVVLSDTGATRVIAGFDPAGGVNQAISGFLGTPTIWVNGTQLAGGTAVLQTTLDAALPSATWKVLEIRDMNVSSLVGLRVGQFTSFQLAADLAFLILCPALLTAVRDQVRHWAGQRLGLAF